PFTMHRNNFAIFSACACALALLSAARAQVPTYRVDPIVSYSVSTTLQGASEAGHLVGHQTVNGQIRAFVAKLGEGLTQLPLPPNYVSSTALGANSSGVIVGAVADNGFPFDLGEPAIWTPNGAGGYDVASPQQFQSLPSPLGGALPVDGGMAVAVNESGTIVGWSRYFGFQGGPSTVFSLTAPPVTLGALGFAATVTSINNHDVAAGGQIRFDLKTNTATDIGLPVLEP
ncbi:MAG: hypothetical protein RLO38_17095, partial [Roseovarius confluentis]